ncbi:MAG: hypothetical protein K0S61_4470 [Anaerocolumna sp.]|jgi:hypothetical protein|nr:hypothetical protein [Anaerocolumna sp.]
MCSPILIYLCGDSFKISIENLKTPYISTKLNNTVFKKLIVAKLYYCLHTKHVPMAF